MVSFLRIIWGLGGLRNIQRILTGLSLFNPLVFILPFGSPYDRNYKKSWQRLFVA
jgi:hypothetical protein